MKLTAGINEMNKWSIFVSLILMLWIVPYAYSQTNGIKKGIKFSELPLLKQRAIIDRVAPPKIHERDAPYSTPMYYLLSEGYRDGVGSMSGKGNLVLDRNRPDWQEELLKDWVDLGLTSTHFLTYPSQWEKSSTIDAIEDYFRISKKYGMKIGIRLGGDKSFGGLEASGWDLHPNNPNNRIDEYIEWARRVSAKGKGRVSYYVLGDELNLGGWEAPTGEAGKTEGHRVDEDKKWTPEIYMRVFPKLAEAIKTIDPEVKVSMFGMGGLDWEYVNGLFKEGYAEHADGVAANIGNKPAEEIQRFVKKVTTAAPDFKFYSNGVGYVRAKNTNFYPTNTTGKYDDEEQGTEVAKIMFRGFDAGWESTPYYIVVRQWQLADGTFAPHWYGLMGFTDLVLDSYDNLTFKHYPAWYSFQTIAHIFYSQSKTTPASFHIKMSKPVDFYRVYTRNDYECLLVLWNNEEKEESVSITLPTQKYLYPVKISLYNYRELSDVTYDLKGEKDLVMPEIRVGKVPVIIRLVSEEKISSAQKPDLYDYKDASKPNERRIED
jgi:hypothetical protein